jgi:hypothetical protein
MSTGRVASGSRVLLTVRSTVKSILASLLRFARHLGIHASSGPTFPILTITSHILGGVPETKLNLLSSLARLLGITNEALIC